MSVEETALACSLPGFVVISPADEVATRELVRLAAAHRGPVFVRTGRPKAPVVYGAGQRFDIGRSIELVAGNDITIFANGLLVAEAIRVAETLEGENVSVRVVDMHTVKPLDREAVRQAAVETGAIVVAEEHLVDGGLGVRIAQVVAEHAPCPIEFVGIRDTYAESGTPEELMAKYGLTSAEIEIAARKVLGRKQ
jgi:transketolase